MWQEVLDDVFILSLFFGVSSIADYDRTLAWDMRLGQSSITAKRSRKNS